MAPPKRFRLTVEEQHARLAESIDKQKPKYPVINGLKDAIAYHVGLSATMLDARLKLEKRKKTVKKDRIDPKTLEVLDPTELKKTDKRLKKVEKASADMGKVLAQMSQLEKESLDMKTKLEKASKKGLSAIELNRFMKDAKAQKGRMEKATKGFLVAMATAEANLRIIEKGEAERLKQAMAAGRGIY
ncbi:hypothetical protein AB2B41_11195 [Marimonas sp. MJW-29]|uniref:Uncharacterized protein n=1 Tax=Sulfitobacter sediminis TaxID=3234186 RepID=A0ABV3RMP5_9RHOB